MRYLTFRKVCKLEEVSKLCLQSQRKNYLVRLYRLDVL